MKDYKVYQRYYNLTHRHDDFLENLDYKEKYDTADVVEEACNYFSKEVDLVFPAKSYAVALIYSKLIENNFGTPFFDSLSDPQLFCGNDKYFKPYFSDKKIYDLIISSVGILSKNYSFNLNLSQVRKTVDYFEAEFGIKKPIADI